jgi:hypothetical protein
VPSAIRWERESLRPSGRGFCRFISTQEITQEEEVEKGEERHELREFFTDGRRNKGKIIEGKIMK